MATDPNSLARLFLQTVNIAGVTFSSTLGIPIEWSLRDVGEFEREAPCENLGKSLCGLRARDIECSVTCKTAKGAPAVGATGNFVATEVAYDGSTSVVTTVNTIRVTAVEMEGAGTRSGQATVRCVQTLAAPAWTCA